MIALIELMKDILINGYGHDDRTGTGRRSVVGRQIRFDLSKGQLPLVTTRKIYPRSMIAELLWFIKGDSDITELKEAGCKFWDRWAVGEEHIDRYIEKFASPLNTEERASLRQTLSELYLHQIGPIYGSNWRNAAQGLQQNYYPVHDLDLLPSDKLRDYQAAFDEHNEQAAELDRYTDFKEYANFCYQESIDQLNNLIIDLKTRPYSSRLVVTAWLPSVKPFEELSPQENVLIGRGALAACHAMFQCFVKPPLEEGGRKRLSLLMYQR